MATQYSIDPAQLTQSASKVNSQAGEILDRIRAVMNEVQSTRGFWTGRANGEYERLMQEWQNTANAVHRSLDETVKALNVAASQYAETESANATRFAG